MPDDADGRPRPPPEVHLDTSRGGQRLTAAVREQGSELHGRVLALHHPMFRCELAEREAGRLLALLMAHFYPVRPRGGRLRLDPLPPPRPVVEEMPTAARLVVHVLVDGPAAEPGRRTAEACRLLGVALGRIEAGEAEGDASDQAGRRWVRWRAHWRPGPPRDGRAA